EHGAARDEHGPGIAAAEADSPARWPRAGQLRERKPPLLAPLRVGEDRREEAVAIGDGETIARLLRPQHEAIFPHCPGRSLVVHGEREDLADALAVAGRGPHQMTEAADRVILGRSGECADRK